MKPKSLKHSVGKNRGRKSHKGKCYLTEGTFLILKRKEKKQIQLALVICGLFICEFVYMRLKNGLFSGTYPLIYSDRWSFYMQINYMQAYFWSPYLSHITRSTSFLTKVINF